MAGGGKLGQSKKERWAGEGDSAKKTGYGILIAAEKVVRGKWSWPKGMGASEWPAIKKARNHSKG